MSSIHKFSDSEESDSKSELKRKRLYKQRKKESPLNLDRQCGVVSPPSNEPCARAITCKIHPVGAKKAVEGRSLQLKDLINIYRKKGGLPPVPANTDKDGDIKMVLEEVIEESQEEDVDSDEETQTIYQALKSSQPRPLGERSVYFVQRRRKYFKIRDILLEAMTPKSCQMQMDI